ncbi:MAG: alpha/beta hydrolase [Alphaproteobacteria bacterium]
MTADPPDFVTRPDGVRLAVRRRPGDPARPEVLVLHGFRSDMTGEKALHVAAWCADNGIGCTRLDLSGHGASEGAFIDGCIGTWAQDALLVLDRLTSGPQVLFGSSMGGWIMLLLALSRPQRVAGLVGVAAAPDFTEDLLWAPATEEQRAWLLAQGQISVPSAYSDEPNIFTRLLVEDGRDHLVLRAPIPFAGPVRLLHGQRDPDVPWQTGLVLAERLASDDVRVTLVKDGDHRLSRPADLALLTDLLAEVVGITRSAS